MRSNLLLLSLFLVSSQAWGLSQKELNGFLRFLNNPAKHTDPNAKVNLCPMPLDDGEDAYNLCKDPVRALCQIHSSFEPDDKAMARLEQVESSKKKYDSDIKKMALETLGFEGGANFFVNALAQKGVPLSSIPTKSAEELIRLRDEISLEIIPKFQKFIAGTMQILGNHMKTLGLDPQMIEKIFNQSKKELIEKMKKEKSLTVTELAALNRVSLLDPTTLLKVSPAASLSMITSYFEQCGDKDTVENAFMLRLSKVDGQKPVFDEQGNQIMEDGRMMICPGLIFGLAKGKYPEVALTALIGHELGHDFKKFRKKDPRYQANKFLQKISSNYKTQCQGLREKCISERRACAQKLVRACFQDGGRNKDIRCTESNLIESCTNESKSCFDSMALLEQQYTESLLKNLAKSTIDLSQNYLSCLRQNSQEPTVGQCFQLTEMEIQLAVDPRPDAIELNTQDIQNHNDRFNAMEKALGYAPDSLEWVSNEVLSDSYGSKLMESRLAQIPRAERLNALLENPLLEEYCADVNNMLDQENLSAAQFELADVHPAGGLRLKAMLSPQVLGLLGCSAADQKSACSR